MERTKTIEMQVPRELVGYIIGRGGETIRELQNKSGAQIQIVREEIGAPQTPHRFVSVEGGEDAIEMAQQLIQRLIDERVHGGSRMDSGMGSISGSRYGDTMEMHVPNERVGLIIGRAGATIKSIQQRTDTSINIPQTADPNHPNMRLITITGSEQAKEAAKAEILSIMNEDQRNGGGGGNGQIIYMQVPNDRVGVVIGKRGETVKGIQDRFGVRIQIPQVMDPGSNPPVRTISIQGGPEALVLAKQELDMVILNGAGTHGTGYASQSNSYGGYDQQYGQYGYGTEGQYDAAYYQQYAAAAAAATVADPAAATATTTATGTTAQADPNDPNAYWNGFYEYAAYYGIDAANEAWGVTGEAAVASAEAYRQYQETNAAATVVDGTEGSGTTETVAKEGEGDDASTAQVRLS